MLFQWLAWAALHWIAHKRARYVPDCIWERSFVCKQPSHPYTFLAILSGAALPWVTRWLAASPLQTSILVGVGNGAWNCLDSSGYWERSGVIYQDIFSWFFKAFTLLVSYWTNVQVLRWKQSCCQASMLSVLQPKKIRAGKHSFPGFWPKFLFLQVQGAELKYLSQHEEVEVAQGWAAWLSPPAEVTDGTGSAGADGRTFTLLYQATTTSSIWINSLWLMEQ